MYNEWAKAHGARKTESGPRTQSTENQPASLTALPLLRDLSDEAGRMMAPTPQR